MEEEDPFSELTKNRYRFGGYRYGLRGPSTYGPDDIIKEIPGLFTFPRKEQPSLDKDVDNDGDKNGQG